MQLTSISFIFYFLPLFLGVYYITPEKEKILVTIIASVIFFLLQDGIALWQVLFAIFLTILTFLIGTELCKQNRKFLLPVALFLLTTVIAFFKCFRGGKLLPAGMSFYIFQMAAYLIDIYKKRVTPENNLISYSAQILMFPKLLSGPLVEPQRLQAQMNRPKLNQIRFRSGLQDLVLGLSMKILLADRLAGLWSQAAVVGYDSISVGFSWLSLIAFALRLYFDFYGYSLIAVGLGRMMGFELPINFRDPYSARSVSEFYRRWHITLENWFRDYIYIPLGGSRKGKGRTVFNVLIVWLITGLWHGMGGNYLLWGLFLGVLIVNEKLWLGKVLEKSPVAAHGYTIAVILLSWVPFAIGDWSQMVMFFTQLFGFGGGTVGISNYLRYLPLLGAGVVCASPVLNWLIEEFRESFWFDCVLFVLFWTSIYFASTAGQDPFLYFNF